MSTVTGSRGSRVGVIVAAVVLAVSAGTAGFFGVSWAVAANSGAIDLAAERDRVLQAGRTAIINFNTLDHRHVRRGLDRWERSSTGKLHDQVVRGRQQNAERIRKAKSVTTAKVLGSALTELNARAGKASMIAVVKVTVTPQGERPTVKRSRYRAELARADGTWKLSALGPVQVGPPAA